MIHGILTAICLVIIVTLCKYTYKQFKEKRYIKAILCTLGTIIFFVFYSIARVHLF